MILVTGINGFIGHALSKELSKRDIFHKGVSRRIDNLKNFENIQNIYALGSINRHTDWSLPLTDIKVVVHCASAPYDINMKLEDYRLINKYGTQRLALQSIDAGVKRIIYISSIRVFGTSNYIPFKGKSLYDNLKSDSMHLETTLPLDDYGKSKLEAEKDLLDIAARTGLEVVIVRPPLVIGPNVKGNLKRLVKLGRLPIPLPFGNMKNKRSFIGIDNLIDMLINCLDNSSAPGNIFLVSDEERLSTSELISEIRAAFGLPSLLFAIPVNVLRFAFKSLNKERELTTLLSSMCVDNSYTYDVLGWKPKVKIRESIKKMCRSYDTCI